MADVSPGDVHPGLGVLGPVTAWDADGNVIALKGPRHRSVLARLIIARGRVVPVAHLVDDLWDDPPADPVGALRTFVAALRRALEPDRSPRTPARLLVTEGPGYALRVPMDAVDAWWFERAVADAAKLPPEEATVRLDEALGRWRGPAYAGFAEQPWARADSRRLTELRLHAVELRAEALLSVGEADRAAADLRAHGAEHPWRENAWRLLALALYRTGRQADALEVLRGARTLLADQLGIDPGPGLRALEEDILHQAEHLGRGDRPAGAVGRVRPAVVLGAITLPATAPQVRPTVAPGPTMVPGPPTLARPVTVPGPPTLARPVTVPGPPTLARPVTVPGPPTLARPVTVPGPPTLARPVTVPGPPTLARPVTVPGPPTLARPVTVPGPPTSPRPTATRTPTEPPAPARPPHRRAPPGASGSRSPPPTTAPSPPMPAPAWSRPPVCCATSR
ncbi:hypothetical protein SCHAM137S_05921 [Streptomyces chartreusis]